MFLNACTRQPNGARRVQDAPFEHCWARSHTGVMDYDEACFMHLTPGVVHNFPKAVGV